MAVLAIMALIGLTVSQYFIWVYAPLEQTMGVVQKIFYFHLPLAWWALFSFFLVFVASIVFLIKKDPKWDGLAGAAAESGVLLSGLALISGSLWGRAAWNTWWTWDPRLTTTLVMWFGLSMSLTPFGTCISRNVKKIKMNKMWPIGLAKMN